MFEGAKVEEVHKTSGILVESTRGALVSGLEGAKIASRFTSSCFWTVPLRDSWGHSSQCSILEEMGLREDEWGISLIET